MATIIGEVKYQLSLDYTKFTQDLEKVSQLLTKTQLQMNDMSRGMASTLTSISKIGDTAKEASKGVQELAKSADNVAKSTSKINTKNLSQEFNLAGINVNKFTDSLFKIGSVGGTIGNTLGSLGKVVTTFGSIFTVLAEGAALIGLEVSTGGLATIAVVILGALGAFNLLTEGIKGVQEALSSMVEVGIKGLEAIINFIGESIQKYGQFQQSQIAINTLLGNNAELGDKIISQIDVLSTFSPTMDVLEGRAAAARMISAGIDPDSMVADFKAIGDISAATGTKMSQIVYVYSQISAAGRIAGNDWLQLANANIPIYDMLGKVLGKSADEIVRMRQAGDTITFDNVREAFQMATSDGGKFEDFMYKMATTTIPGLQNVLSNLFSIIQTDIGSVFGPIVIPILRAFGAVLINIHEYLQANGPAISAYILDIAKQFEGPIAGAIVIAEKLAEMIFGIGDSAMENADPIEIFASLIADLIMVIETCIYIILEIIDTIGELGSTIYNYLKIIVEEIINNFIYWYNVISSVINGLYALITATNSTSGPLAAIRDWVINLASAFDTLIGKVKNAIASLMSFEGAGKAVGTAIGSFAGGAVSWMLPGSDPLGVGNFLGSEIGGKIGSKIGVNIDQGIKDFTNRISNINIEGEVKAAWDRASSLLGDIDYSSGSGDGRGGGDTGGGGGGGGESEAEKAEKERLKLLEQASKQVLKALDNMYKKHKEVFDDMEKDWEQYIDIQQQIAEDTSPIENIMETDESFQKFLDNVADGEENAKDFFSLWKDGWKDIKNFTEDQIEAQVELIDELRDKLNEIDTELLKLQEDYQKATQDRTKTFFEQAAQTTQEASLQIQELQDQLMAATDLDEQQKIIAQIREQEKILETSKQLTGNIEFDKALSEEQKMAAMNPLERLIYIHDQEQKLADESYQQEVDRLNNLSQATYAAVVEEDRIFQKLQQDKINYEQQFTSVYVTELNRRLEAARSAANEEITMMKSIAEASYKEGNRENYEIPKGFASGGFTGGIAGRIAGMVHGNEWVAPPWMVKSNTSFFRSLDNYRMSGGSKTTYNQPITMNNTIKDGADFNLMSHRLAWRLRT
ncbi:MAG: tape measure protein [Candidatus Paceibacterota bacterium]|jgi:tape measure domain-containing protein